MSIRLKVWEFLAAPGFAWLWVCAKLCGYRFQCGPADDMDGSPDGTTGD